LFRRFVRFFPYPPIRAPRLRVSFRGARDPLLSSCRTPAPSTTCRESLSDVVFVPNRLICRLDPPEFFVLIFSFPPLIYPSQDRDVCFCLFSSVQIEVLLHFLNLLLVYKGLNNLMIRKIPLVVYMELEYLRRSIDFWVVGWGGSIVCFFLCHPRCMWFGTYGCVCFAP